MSDGKRGGGLFGGLFGGGGAGGNGGTGGGAGGATGPGGAAPPQASGGSEYAYMHDIFLQFLKEAEWNYSVDQKGGVIRFGINGDNGSWRCVIAPDEERALFRFYSIREDNTPEGRRPAMAEALSRANYGLNIGNFEIDLNDGEVRYKTSLSLRHTTLTTPLCSQQVSINIETFDRYLPAIDAVVNGEDPQVAIDRVEGR
jgi:hypothetical protein